MRRLLPIALTILALAPPSGAAAAPRSTAIQPGAQVRTPAGNCTLNFVFQESDGTKYVGTAGHCGSEGQVARSASPNREIGPIVWSENRDAPGVDFALIKIDPSRYGEVEPAVRMFGGPTGVTAPADTGNGDLLAITGYGVGVGMSEATRHRAGVLMTDSRDEYVANMPALPGDSGGPVLHLETGKALGVVSRFNTNLPPSTDIGPTVQRILERLRTTFPSIVLVEAALAR